MKKKIPKKEVAERITIRLRKADVDKARELAEQKGLGYQTYLRLLVSDALQQIEVRP